MRTRRPLVITGVAVAALLCVGSISYATTGAWVPGTGGDDEAAVTAVTRSGAATSTAGDAASTEASSTSSAPAGSPSSSEAASSTVAAAGETAGSTGGIL